MQVKGSVLRARVLFVDEQGPEAKVKVVDALGPAARSAVEDGFLLNRWYPLEVHNELVHVIDEVLGSGDRGMCKALGRDSCQRNLTTIYRVFLRVGGIHFLLGRVAQAWSVHYDAGRMILAGKTKNSATLEIHDVPRPSPYHCLPIVGWCHRAAELSGCKNVSHQILSCRARGDEVCRFAFEWT